MAIFSGTSKNITEFTFIYIATNYSMFFLKQIANLIEIRLSFLRSQYQ